MYYTDASLSLKAEEIALFWKENDLLTGRQQHIQLTKLEEVFVLNIIQSDKESNLNISFDERKLLNDLQSSIRKTTFPKDKFELRICNNKFEPIYKLD